MRKIAVYVVLTFLSVVLCRAQQPRVADTAKSNVSRMSGTSLCMAFGADARMFDGQESLDAILDSISKVHPNAYPLMGQWCITQSLHLRRMSASMRNDYKWDNGIIWIDSTHCITDATETIGKCDQLISTLTFLSRKYEQLEAERIEAERIAAEEHARAEARRIQQEKDQKLKLLKDTILTLHRDIQYACNNTSTPDKNRVKELKDIFYAYLSIYNRYDLTGTTTDDNRFTQLNELESFQKDVIDSLIGSNSYYNQIENFKNTIRSRAGNSHTDILKAYNRAFKKVQTPVTFKSMAEYQAYITQLQNIRATQDSYIKAIELQDTLAKNTLILQEKCSKEHREIFNAYKSILGEQNLVPSYSDYSSAKIFISSLYAFINIQHDYIYIVQRMDTISKRGIEITQSCSKQTSDVASAYKELSQTTDFIPYLRNESDVKSHNRMLNHFEEIQDIYLRIVNLRDSINTRSEQILAAKNTPKGLLNSYKQTLKTASLTPHFREIDKGDIFVRQLEHFIAIQEKYLLIEDKDHQIDNTTKRFRTTAKEYGNISKAYEHVAKTYDMEFNALNESDLDAYLSLQDRILDIQNKFDAVLNSTDKAQYNQMFKKESDPGKIKLIMGIK